MQVTAKENVKRVRRSPINGTRSILGVNGKDPNFEYRIVKDIGDRVDMFKGNGWETVSDNSVTIGERRVSIPTKDGSTVTTLLDKTEGTKGVLMRIRKDWFDEDQKAKQALVDETEAQVKRDANEKGFYGKLEVTKD